MTSCPPTPTGRFPPVAVGIALFKTKMVKQFLIRSRRKPCGLSFKTKGNREFSQIEVAASELRSVQLVPADLRTPRKARDCDR
jgi:hypothetical protein